MGCDVSVVVPCRDEAVHIGQLLKAVLDQDAAVTEVVIVDGGSTDDSVGVVQQFQVSHPQLSVSLVVLQGASIPAVVNAGIQAARGDVIVRLDAHSYPNPDYVGTALRTAEVERGVVGGAWDVVPGASTNTARAIAAAVSHPVGTGDAAYRLDSTRKEPLQVDTVPFGCFSKALWEELGGFNECLLANEDYEFNYRARLAGRPVVLNAQMRSTYFARATLGELARQYFRYGWWKFEMLKLHPASLRWRQVLPVLLVAGFLCLAAGSLLGPPVRQVFASAVAGYAFILSAVAIGQTKVLPWSVVSILPAAFAVIHFAWGGAVLVNLLTLGHWPTWSARLSRSGEPCSR